VCGAELVLLDGLISDCGRLVALLARSTGAFDVATLKEPYRLEGKKTLGFEIAEDLDWALPDAIVYPTGGGTGLIGMWKAFDELEAIGLIGADRPRMFSAQAEGCQPIVRAFERGDELAEPWPDAKTEAAGIRVPSALGDHLILDCLRKSKGAALAVPEAELRTMQAFAARSGAGYLSLESAAALAALPALRDKGLIDAGETIVVFDTAAGFKSTPAVVELPEPVANDPDVWASRWRL
jgi:threonine synthase